MTLIPDLDNASVGTERSYMPFAYEKALPVFGRAFIIRKISEDTGISFPKKIIIRRKEKMNASVAIQSLPEAANDEELIRIVDEVIAYIKSTGLNYYVGPFETAIEGEYDELMDIVKECQHIAIRAGAPSVAAYIKVTYRPEGDVLTIEKKVTKHHQ